MSDSKYNSEGLTESQSDTIRELNRDSATGGGTGTSAGDIRQFKERCRVYNKLPAHDKWRYNIYDGGFGND